MGPPISFARGVTLVGGGAAAEPQLRRALALAPHLVAADGGADAAAACGLRPEAVIGDMDSVAALEVWRATPGVRVERIAEQDSTDFEKCLYTVAAPFYVGVGFLGRRLDHSLAALHVLAKTAAPVVLLGRSDVAFRAPPGWRLRVGAGARVSLFPMGPARATACAGLEWPVTGLTLAPMGRIGTSNRAAADVVGADFEGGPVLVLLEPEQLEAAVACLAARRP